MRKRNQGITLIALIITIIIMLILVAVSIDLIVDGKLFDSAGDAVSKTNEKVEQQQNRVNELMEKLDNVEKMQIKHNWKYTDNTMATIICECETCKKENTLGRTLNIGKEIPYTAGPTDAQWVVFGTEDCDKNGTNETLLITTLAPSTEKLTLEGADGYVNGIAKIETKVKEIYGNEARAMKIEDVNRTLGYTPAGGMYSTDGSTFKSTGNFTTKLSELEIWSYIQSYNENSGKYYTPEYPEGTTDATELKNYLLDGYFYKVSSGASSLTGVPVVSETTSNVVKNLVFGTSSSKYINWLSSRGVYGSNAFADFGLGAVKEGTAYSAFFVFVSSGYTETYEFSVRAVIPLKSEIPEEGEMLVSSDAWT